MSGCSASSSPSLVPFAVQTGAKAPGFSPTAPEFTAETDSPLEGGVSCELVSEKENSERRQIGRFYEDWERFLMPQSAFSLLQIPKMVAFLPIVAGPGSAH